MESLEDKIRCYKLIVSTINNIERELFSE
jgi:hypothetical protein